MPDENQFLSFDQFESIVGALSTVVPLAQLVLVNDSALYAYTVRYNLPRRYVSTLEFGSLLDLAELREKLVQKGYRPLVQGQNCTVHIGKHVVHITQLPKQTAPVSVWPHYGISAIGINPLPEYIHKKERSDPTAAHFDLNLIDQALTQDPSLANQ